MSGNLDKRRKRTRIMVFCAIVCALSFILSMIGTISGVFDLASVFFSGLLVGLLFLELGARYALMVWAVTSALLLLFLPDKLVAMEYLLFAGIYPVIKVLLEGFSDKKAWKFLCYLPKLIYFNLILTGLILLATSVRLFMTPDNDLTMEWIVYAIGNAFFLLCDICYSVYITAYKIKLRSRLKLAAWLGNDR